MSLTDAIGPFDARPARLPAGYPSMDGPTGELEYGNAAQQATTALLWQALADAGIDLFAFDQQVVGLIGTSDPAIVRAVAGWIIRAHRAGLDTANADAVAASIGYSQNALGALLGSLLRSTLTAKSQATGDLGQTLATRITALNTAWTTR